MAMSDMAETKTNMNFLERRSLKRIQQELSRFLSPGEIVVDFDLADCVMIFGAEGLDELRTGQVRIAISNLAIWVAIPPSTTEKADLLQASWAEVLAFNYNTKTRAHDLVLIDGRRYFFNSRFPRDLSTYATDRIRMAEATMSAEQIEARKLILSETLRR
jgi:hypothetical protein